MKKLLSLTMICLFCITGVFAQWDDIEVTWNVDNGCDCYGSIDSTFKVVLIIDDVANNVNDILGTDNTNWEPGSATNSFFAADKVKEYCEELNHDYTPNFTLSATVEMWCEGSSQIIVCDGKGDIPGISCLNFSNGGVSVSGIQVEP